MKNNILNRADILSNTFVLNYSHRVARIASGVHCIMATGSCGETEGGEIDCGDLLGCGWAG
jgi:hypothetical protein